MEKIRIVEPGWETFTGSMGGAEFVNGESVEPVTQVQVDRIGASIRIELESGKQGGIQERLVSMKGVEVAELVGMPVMTEADVEAQKVNEVKAAEAAMIFHSEAELEAIALEKGLKGLRALGDPLGVKGRSIPELIREILAAEKVIKDRVEAAAAADAASAPAANEPTDAPAEAPTEA